MIPGIIWPNLARAAEQDDWEYEPYTYEGVEGVAVTAYQGGEVDVIIPESLDEKPVFAVKAEAFKDDAQINSVTLSDSVRLVEDYAFAGCTEMRCAIMNEELVGIGDYAFAGNNLMNSVIIYPSTVAIGEHAFDNCTELLIYCYDNSAAHQHAKNHSVSYQIFGDGKIVILERVTYLLSRYEGTLILCDKSREGEVNVPQEIEGRQVTMVGRGAFANCRSVFRIPKIELKFRCIL